MTQVSISSASEPGVCRVPWPPILCKRRDNRRRLIQGTRMFGADDFPYWNGTVLSSGEPRCRHDAAKHICRRAVGNARVPVVRCTHCEGTQPRANGSDLFGASLSDTPSRCADQEQADGRTLGCRSSYHGTLAVTRHANVQLLALVPPITSQAHMLHMHSCQAGLAVESCALQSVQSPVVMDWAGAWTDIAGHVSLGGVLAAGAFGLAAWWVLSTEWDRVPRIAVRLDPGVGRSPLHPVSGSMFSTVGHAYESLGSPARRSGGPGRIQWPGVEPTRKAAAGRDPML